MPTRGQKCTSLLGVVFLALLMFGSIQMGEYDRYSHKRTGRLVHSYGATTTSGALFTSTVDYFVNEIYSYHAHGDTNFDVTHNCTMVKSKSYNNLEDAQSAAQSVQLGEFRTVFVAKDDRHSCIDYNTRTNDFIIGLIALISLPILFFVVLSGCLCYVLYISDDIAAARTNESDYRANIYEGSVGEGDGEGGAEEVHFSDIATVTANGDCSTVHAADSATSSGGVIGKVAEV